jgi:hypothetical protein
LCLAGYAQLALAEGDPQRAARLEGAAEGLRRRVGLSAWPPLRRMEADLVAQIRQRLGAGQFDQAFSAGSRLTQREAVAIARNQPSTGTRTPWAAMRNSAETAAWSQVWLLEPLWDQFAALLPDRPVYDPSHPLGCHKPRIPDRAGLGRWSRWILMPRSWPRRAAPEPMPVPRHGTDQRGLVC